jgi:hypothetical protein
MMGEKKLSEIKADVAALLRRLPGRSPRAWLAKQIKSARADRKRDVETLEMLCAALEREPSPKRKPKPRRTPASGRRKLPTP